MAAPKKKPFKTIATLATFSSREEQCQRAVESLLPQVDAVFVYRNSGTFTHPNVYLITGKDLHSNGKFIASILGENVFVCDDDIIYPHDYVSTTLALPEYKSCVITWHAKIFPQGTLKSFRHDCKEFLIFGNDTLKGKYIHVAGAGVLAFNHNVYTPDHLEWEYTNMDDISFSQSAKRQGVKIYSPKKKAGWIIPLNSRESISQHTRNTDLISTFVYNQYPCG